MKTLIVGVVVVFAWLAGREWGLNECSGAMKKSLPPDAVRMSPRSIPDHPSWMGRTYTNTN